MHKALSDNKFQLDVLDGLRGLAVLIVFLSHISNEGVPLFAFADFSGTGKSGVFLFFILSSFLLTRPFVHANTGAFNKNFFMNYFIRRFTRIYPLYFLYLLLGLVTTAMSTSIFKSDRPMGVPFAMSPTDFCEHLLLMQGWGVTWSVVVEFHYYLILPVLAIIHAVILKNKWHLSLILTTILIIVSQLLWPPSDSMNNDTRLGPYFPIFFIGALLAVFFHEWQKRKLSENKNLVHMVDVLGILAILLLVFTIPSVSTYIMGKEVPFDYYHRQFTLFGTLWAMLVFSCVAGSGLLRKPFELSILRYLGHISFSVYLLHVVVLKLVQKAVPGLPMQGWIVLALTITVSHVTYTLIERPISKIKWSF